MAAARAPFELGGHTIAAGSSATIELPVADLYTHPGASAGAGAARQEAGAGAVGQRGAARR